ncbi:MAG: hypothetical protein NC246_15175, partial [Muribaculaceae bacterium]|nr:hypothetical protein [Muribaculaceae bacterium]
MTKDKASVSSPNSAQENSTDSRKISDEAPELTTNLSDFALFLTVMKDKTAYRNTLSIILDEKDLWLKEVKVEQVI